MTAQRISLTSAGSATAWLSARNATKLSAELYSDDDNLGTAVVSIEYGLTQDPDAGQAHAFGTPITLSDSTKSVRAKDIEAVSFVRARVTTGDPAADPRAFITIQLFNQGN